MVAEPVNRILVRHLEIRHRPFGRDHGSGTGRAQLCSEDRVGRGVGGAPSSCAQAEGTDTEEIDSVGLPAPSPKALDAGIERPNVPVD